MSARLDLFFQGYGRAPVPTPKGRLDLFFGVAQAPQRPGRLDLLFLGGAGYPAPIVPPSEGGGEYLPTYRPRRRM